MKRFITYILMTFLGSLLALCINSALFIFILTVSSKTNLLLPVISLVFYLLLFGGGYLLPHYLSTKFLSPTVFSKLATFISLFVQTLPVAAIPGLFFLIVASNPEHFGEESLLFTQQSYFLFALELILSAISALIITYNLHLAFWQKINDTLKTNKVTH